MSSSSFEARGWVDEDVYDRIPDDTDDDGSWQDASGTIRTFFLQVKLGTLTRPVPFREEDTERYVPLIVTKMAKMRIPFSTVKADEVRLAAAFPFDGTTMACFLLDVRSTDTENVREQVRKRNGWWHQRTSGWRRKDGETDVFVLSDEQNAQENKAKEQEDTSGSRVARVSAEEADAESTPIARRTRSRRVRATSRITTNQPSSSLQAPARQASPALRTLQTEHEDAASVPDADANAEAPAAVVDREASETPSETSCEMNLSRVNHHFEGSEERRLFPASLPINSPQQSGGELSNIGSATPTASSSSSSYMLGLSEYSSLEPNVSAEPRTDLTYSHSSASSLEREQDPAIPPSHMSTSSPFVAPASIDRDLSSGLDHAVVSSLPISLTPAGDDIPTASLSSSTPSSPLLPQSVANPSIIQATSQQASSSSTGANTLIPLAASPFPSHSIQPASVPAPLQAAPSTLPERSPSPTNSRMTTLPGSDGDHHDDPAEDDVASLHIRSARRSPTPPPLQILLQVVQAIFGGLFIMLVVAELSWMDPGISTRIFGVAELVRRGFEDGWIWIEAVVEYEQASRNSLHATTSTGLGLCLLLTLSIGFAIHFRTRILHVICTVRNALYTSIVVFLQSVSSMPMRPLRLLRQGSLRAWLILLMALAVTVVAIIIAVRGTDTGLSGLPGTIENKSVLEFTVPPVLELTEPLVPSAPHEVPDPISLQTAIAAHGCVVTPEGCPYPGTGYSTREHVFGSAFVEPVYIHYVTMTVHEGFINLLEVDPKFLALELWGLPSGDGLRQSSGDPGHSATAQTIQPPQWIYLDTAYLPMAHGEMGLLRWDVDETPFERTFEVFKFQAQGNSWLWFDVKSVDVVGWRVRREEKDEADASVGTRVGGDEGET